MQLRQSSPSEVFEWNSFIHNLTLIWVVSYKPEDINQMTGAVWIIVIFLSAVWALSLTAPIHCKESIGEQVM